MIDNFLRLNDVTKSTGLSRASIYRYMREGVFPKSVRLGPRSVAWRESEVEQWKQSIVGQDDNKESR